MSTETVNQLVDRLVEPGPLTAERFAARLGTPLAAGQADPFWRIYTAELSGGLFARAELRLNTSNTGALLILEPRADAALTKADVNMAALGEPLGMRPNLRIPPEGVVSEYFRKEGVKVITQWTANSRRLRNLVLEWEPPTVEGTPAANTHTAAGAD